MAEQEKESSFYDLFYPLTTTKAIVFIVIIGFAVYFNVLFNGFVWDDNTYIINYKQLHTLNLPFLFGNNLFNVVGQYRPIPALYFSILYSLFSNMSFFYHLLQLVLHILCTIILFTYFKKFFTIAISLFASLIFLVHPINVESVSYIAQSGSSIFMIFGLVALIIAENSKLLTKQLISIFILSLLSILTKETGGLFLGLMLVYSVVFVKKKDHFIKLFTLSSAVGLIYIFTRTYIGHVGFTVRPFMPFAQLSFLERLMHMPIVIFYYISTFFFPRNLAVDQQWIISTINGSSFYYPLFLDLVFLSVVSLIGYYFYRKQKQRFKVYIFFLAWFSMGLFMHSQIFTLDNTVADRYFYFPLVGLIGMLAVCLQEVLRNIKSNKVIYLIITICIVTVSLLSIRTIIRNSNWHDNLSLFSHDVQYTTSSDLENYLGNEYVTLGDYKNARIHFIKSVNLFPYETNLFNVGLTYSREKNNVMASKYFKQAIENYRGSIDKKTLAWYMIAAGDPKDAIILIQKGLSEKPDDLQLLIYLAVAEFRSGNKQKALETAKKTYSLYPNTQTQSLLDQITNNLSTPAN